MRPYELLYHTAKFYDIVRCFDKCRHFHITEPHARNLAFVVYLTIKGLGGLTYPWKCRQLVNHHTEPRRFYI